MLAEARSRGSVSLPFPRGRGTCGYTQNFIEP